ALDQVFAIALAGHADGVVHAAQARHGRARQPVRQERQPPDELIRAVLGVEDALLHHHDLASADVPGHQDVAARDHEIVAAAAAVRIGAQAVAPDVIHAVLAALLARAGVVDEAQLAHERDE